MKKILLFALMGLTAFGADAANDLILSQRNSGNTGNVQRNVSPVINGLIVFNSSKVPVSPSNLTFDSATGQLAATSLAANVGGSSAGALVLSQGTAPSTTVASATIAAPTSVTAYIWLMPGTVGTNNSLLSLSVSGTTGTITPVTALPSGTTATTQTAGTANTTIATTDYADNAAKATNLGTFASPNTAAGSITWTASAVYQVFTSASGATRTYTLPAASTYTGKGLVIYVAAGTNHVNLQPQSGAAFVLNGTLLTTDHYIQAATSAAGNFICMVSDGTNWVSLGSSGTWADASSP